MTNHRNSLFFLLIYWIFIYVYRKRKSDIFYKFFLYIFFLSELIPIFYVFVQTIFYKSRILYKSTKRKNQRQSLATKQELQQCWKYDDDLTASYTNIFFIFLFYFFFSSSGEQIQGAHSTYKDKQRLSFFLLSYDVTFFVFFCKRKRNNNNESKEKIKEIDWFLIKFYISALGFDDGDARGTGSRFDDAFKIRASVCMLMKSRARIWRR